MKNQKRQMEYLKKGKQLTVESVNKEIKKRGILLSQQYVKELVKNSKRGMKNFFKS